MKRPTHPISEPVRFHTPNGRNTPSDHGPVTTYAYDALGRQTSATAPSPDVTTYTYDKVGNMLSLTDPDGNQTTWTYDALNRVLSQTNPLGRVRSYTHNGLIELGGSRAR